jgi:gluconate kinase
MPASLMESQLHTLEEPDADEHPITVSVHGTVEETAERVLAALGAEY